MIKLAVFCVDCELACEMASYIAKYAFARSIIYIKDDEVEEEEATDSFRLYSVLMNHRCLLKADMIAKFASVLDSAILKVCPTAPSSNSSSCIRISLSLKIE